MAHKSLTSQELYDLV